MPIDNKWITIIKMYSGRDELPQLDNMKIEEYASWYAGKVDSFHTYRIYNGDRSIELEKKSLQMPKKVCEDWADILANEKLEIRLANDKDNKVISQILKDNMFHPLLSNAVEKSFSAFCANPGRGGYASAMKASEIIYNARNTVAQFFNTETENVVFTPGCTFSLNSAIKGVAKPNSHFVISDLEHNSVVRPLEKMKNSGVCDYSVAEVSLLMNSEIIQLR